MILPILLRIPTLAYRAIVRFIREPGNLATGGEAEAVSGTVDGMEEEGEADCGGGEGGEGGDEGQRKRR